MATNQKIVNLTPWGERVGSSIEMSKASEDMAELVGATVVIVDENVRGGVVIYRVLNNGVVVNARLKEPSILVGELWHHIYSCGAAIMLLAVLP